MSEGNVFILATQKKKSITKLLYVIKYAALHIIIMTGLDWESYNKSIDLYLILCALSF